MQIRVTEHVDTGRDNSEENNHRGEEEAAEPSQTDYNTRKVHDLLSGVTLSLWRGGKSSNRAVMPVVDI